jgi:hypothetical protein
MDKFVRIPTKTTPLVHLDADGGTYLIAGRSIPLDAELFYAPILSWLDELLASAPRKVEFCFRFEFFNIASSKRILFMLYKLVELQAKGFDVHVRWMSEKYDEDMQEIGNDYALMVDELKFTFELFDQKEPMHPRVLRFG